MKYRTLLPVVVFMIMAVTAVAQGSRGADAPAFDDLEAYLDPARLQALMEDPPDNLFLVDVRTPEEYEAGHIPGAINIDYRALEQNPPTADTEAVIVVYCRSGSRSRAAFMTLESMGYTRLLDWGGIMRWPFDVVTGNRPR